MLENRIALITGAGRGIGRAIATAMARQGATVALTARTKQQLDEVVQQVESDGGRAVAFSADLSQADVPGQLVASVVEQVGPIDILVNNAGIGSSQDPRPLVEFDDDFWDLTMAVNVKAPYLLTKLVLPSMIHSGWGRIINISSINAKVAAVHGAAYTTSKHAVAGLTKATAKEVAAHGITANAICPGVTATMMNDKRVEYDARRLGKSFEEVESQATPLGRRLRPEEMAGLAVFLASPAAAAINGQLINVCGGTVMC